MNLENFKQFEIENPKVIFGGNDSTLYVEMQNGLGSNLWEFGG